MRTTDTKIKILSDGTEVIRTEQPFENLPNSSERLAKVKLAYEINRNIKKRGLKQKDAAQLLDITQPEISNLGKGRLSGFTFDRLYRCLTALQMDIEIKLKEHSAHDKYPVGIHVCGI